MEGQRSPTTKSTDIATEELSRSAQFIEQRPSPIHTLLEAIESFFAEEKKPSPTLALHGSFFDAYKGTGLITNPRTSSNPLGKGMSSIQGPDPLLSNTLPVNKPANTMLVLGDAPLCLTSPPIFLCHLCIVTTSIGSDFTVLTKDSRLLKTFGFKDSKECLGFYSKILS